MQIFLHADPHTDGSHLMADHLTLVVKKAMARFGERVIRIEAHLSDVNSHAKAGSDSIHCTLEAGVVGLEAIVVKHPAGNAHQAIDGALRKLQRAVATEIEKHERHGRRLSPALPDAENAAE